MLQPCRRVILFRFHTAFDVCKNHLELIRAYNPGVSVYGLYGGPASEFKKAQRLPLDSCFLIPLDDAYWKWLNGDLTIRWWFKEIGKKLKFDMLHVFEWDMVLLEPIEKRFAKITEGVAITGRKPLKEVYDTWYWVAPKRGRAEWEALLADVKKKHGYRKQPFCGIFGGVSLSRAFLERYAKEDVRSLCNDEVRVPLYAQAYGLPVHDTGFKSEWFETSKILLSPERIYTAYQQGQTVFHPVREKLDLKRLQQIQLIRETRDKIFKTR